MRIGIIACNILKLELEKTLRKMQWSPEVLYLDSALHITPNKMRGQLVEHIHQMAERVDAVFLGYGFCRSLQGIEAECAVPVILPQVDDCISLLLGPDRYAEETKKEPGTWFMTSGWAEVGADLIIKELRLDRVVEYGRDPMEMAKRLFAHYRRGVFIDTGVGNHEASLKSAEKFCTDFNLTLEQTRADAKHLEKWLEKAHAMVAN